MLLGFKTQLKLNQTTRIQLAKHAGVARDAWNWGLALTKQILDNNKDRHNDKIKFPSAIDLHKWLVTLVKPENPRVPSVRVFINSPEIAIFIHPRSTAHTYFSTPTSVGA